MGFHSDEWEIPVGQPRVEQQCSALPNFAKESHENDTQGMQVVSFLYILGHVQVSVYANCLQICTLIPRWWYACTPGFFPTFTLVLINVSAPCTLIILETSQPSPSLARITSFAYSPIRPIPSSNAREESQQDSVGVCGLIRAWVWSQIYLYRMWFLLFNIVYVHSWFYCLDKQQLYPLYIRLPRTIVCTRLSSPFLFLFLVDSCIPL